MLTAKLVVVGGEVQEKEFQLRLPAVVGRNSDMDVCLDQELVSRQHAEISENLGRLYVRDLGSKNGTFIDNQRIEGQQLLNPNQLLTLGTVTFRAVYDFSADSQVQDIPQAMSSRTDTQLPTGVPPVTASSLQETVSLDQLLSIDTAIPVGNTETGLDDPELADGPVPNLPR